MGIKLTKESFKFRTINRLLYKHQFLMAHINTTAPNVVLPQHLYQAPTVTLKLSREFKGSLELTSDTITAELLFGDDYFTCQIPFDSVWAIGTPDGEVQFWSDSSPTELLERFVETQQPNSDAKPQTEKNNTKSHLRRVK